MANSATCHDLVDSQEYGGQTAATLRRISKQSRRTNCSIELLTFGSLARTVGSKSTCGHAHGTVRKTVEMAGLIREETDHD